MEFFRITPPDCYEFARYSRRGTWVPEKSPGPCPECGMTRQNRVPPLVVEWEPDSAIVGDFSWGGFGSEIVTRRTIAEELIQKFSGFRIEAITMVEQSETISRGKPKVFLPYSGRELCELWVDSWETLDETASGIVHEKTCSVCGFRFYKPKKSGLALQKDAKPSSIFRVEQFPSWIFCLDTIKEYILERGWSNVSFEAGSEDG